MMEGYDLSEVIMQIDPSRLDYQDWLAVGMALKHAGFSCDQWDEWSRQDSARYHSGECEKKWAGFSGVANPVTTGSIVKLAKEQGWKPEPQNYEIEWEGTIGSRDDRVVVDPAWVEGREVIAPDNWDPVGQLVTYLEILFEASENVGYVTECWEKEGRYLPTKGAWDRTAGELIQLLQGCGGDIGSVIGDPKPEAGAWIRFNPLDGQGCKNKNVTDFRYALVESDEMEIEQQNAIIRELELPVAALVHSGGKSIHAIVRVDAGNYDEYRKRVDYLYEVCKKNGLIIDKQNRNPSRLSRMPGILRGGNKQFLVDTNIGKDSWNEWQEWIESVNDDLPEPESLTDVWDDLPALSPPLIEGVLRQGHKMLLAGPSKAGKSFNLIELTIAVAEGRKWLAWQCARGRVLYVNLELDRASCLHRFKEVYGALGWEPEHLRNIDIWNLRGKAVPMDQLAPKLIRRAAKKNYIAIIIDPIYKIITGDENSADQMAKFCNQFDRVCSELGAAVIYCHHHSKGSQGSKRSMDRASGSGVFARDPDALLDLIELEVTEDLLKQETNKAVCAVCKAFLEQHVDDWDAEVSQDDLCSERAMLEACKELLSSRKYKELMAETEAARAACKARTAWRIDGTLREFPKFPAVNLWFDYPVHHVDEVGSLKDVDAEGEAPPWQKAKKQRKKNATLERAQINASLENAIQSCNFGDPPTLKMLAESMGISERTVRDRIQKSGKYLIDKNSKTVVQST